MTDKEKTQIRLLRENGYSYGQIAKLLNLKRSTISNYCLRNKICAPNKVVFDASSDYRLCPQCKRLFIVSGQKDKHFCSNKCRTKYWQTEAKYRQDLEQETSERMTLIERLDFSEELSDELDGPEEIHLCRRNINHLTEGGINDYHERKSNKHPPHSRPNTT